MSKPSKIVLFCAATALALVLMVPAGRTAIAGGPQCLPTGQVWNGDPTVLFVQPCPQPFPGNDSDNDGDRDDKPEPPPGKFGTLYWGYEANFSVPKLNAYRAVTGNPMVASCVPSGPDIPLSSNGRGVAFDPMDGKLWISRLTGFGLPGDNRITKVPPPNASGACPEIKSLLVHFPNGTAPQHPGFGALDMDDSKDIWAAGTPPVVVNGQLRNYFYEVNRNNGVIIQSCYLPALSPTSGNDSLTFARLWGVPGSSRYLLTDNGAFEPSNPLSVIDVAACHNGRQVTPVKQYPNPGMDLGTHFGSGISGIDLSRFGLLNTDTVFSYMNSPTPPFAASTLLGPTGAVFGLEDVSFCGFRVKMDWDGNNFDFCPFD